MEKEAVVSGGGNKRLIENCETTTKDNSYWLLHLKKNKKTAGCIMGSNFYFSKSRWNLVTLIRGKKRDREES